MNKKKTYSIGDMSRICNISKKALRYYDKIGLISPLRQDYNNYRYYTRESLLAVPVLKYYKQMGFRLEEMKDFIEGKAPNVYRKLNHSFLAKIGELQKEREVLRRRLESIEDWNGLIMEAEMVLDNAIEEVSVKYVEANTLVFQNQEYDNDIKASIINIDFTNFVESLGTEISGPVILNFTSFKDRIKEKSQPMRILQKTLTAVPEEVQIRFGGCMMVTCYHIGPHETIGKTYEKINRWCRQHHYVPDASSFERCVTDYWTTSNADQFVTEVMIKVSRQGRNLME